VNVWLWDAGKWCGVGNSDRAAVAAAEACIASGAAGTARVELARLVLSPRLEPGYERSGTGWTGRRDGGRIAWTDLSDLAPLVRS
jgi:hypothetical protein